jgi:hypothetical protein
MRRSSALYTGIVLVFAVVAGGCSFNPEKNGVSGSGGTGNTGLTGPGGSGGNNTPPVGPCMNLQCRQSTCTKGSCTQPPCAGGARTIVSGTIFDPAGKVPLQGITVYIPNAPLAPIMDGPSCDPCDSATGTSLLSGSPISITKTDVTGKFTLGATTSVGGDVPSGAGVPMVIQVGKWQRQVMLPDVTACQDNPLMDMNMTRLPRDKSEGHIPKMALTTGSADALECLLRKIGIADSEFTPETADGRINFYAGGGGTAAYAATLNGGAALTPVHPWWDSLDNLRKYDIVLHSCEGNFGSFNGGNRPTDPMSVKSMEARQALLDFANMGGRVFASHWHVYWFERGPAPFPTIATFVHGNSLPNPFDATIDTTRADGMTLSQWMAAVNGLTPAGLVTLAQNANQTTVQAAAGGNISERWIYAPNRNPGSVQYLTATTPIPGGSCGRVVMSDIHVSAGAGGAMSDQPAMPFPTGCVTTDLTPQEKVLEFMLFDIAACVVPIIP